MFGYLNERSLEQYGDWASGLRHFLAAAQELSRAHVSLFKDGSFFTQPDFQQRFNGLPFPKDLRGLIRDLVFGSRYYKCWRPQRRSQDDDEYECRNPALRLRDESICEAAEQTSGGARDAVALLSTPQSAFTNISPLVVLKAAEPPPIELRNTFSMDCVRQWITAQRGHYDIASEYAPKDFQTVLVKAARRFQDTGKVERRFSRRIFREIVTGRLYYVDDAHPGNSAHLEVFSDVGDHLGTAEIDIGDLTPGTRVNGRKLKL